LTFGFFIQKKILNFYTFCSKEMFFGVFWLLKALKKTLYVRSILQISFYYVD
jgi:hypothetical protein